MMLDANLEGMSLRDYFAAQALAGLLPTYGREGGIAYSAAAAWAYTMADAMLAERSKQLDEIRKAREAAQ